MRRPTPRRTGWRVKLAWSVALLLPGLLCEELLALAAATDLGPRRVEIGVQYTGSVSGTIYVQCNDSGCGGSGSAAEPFDGLEVQATLSFSPTVAGQRKYDFQVVIGPGHEFIPPLSGQVTFVSGALTENATREVHRRAASRCSDLTIKSISPEKFSLIQRRGPK